jgi:hypothetical protein
MAGNGDDLDFDGTNAPLEELGVQAYHISAEELYEIPEIRDLPVEAVITKNSEYKGTLP